MSDDITFCADSNKCPKKDKCRRAEKPQFKEYASYGNFYEVANGNKCDYFMKGKVND